MSSTLIGQDTLQIKQDSLLPEKQVEVIKSFEARLSKAKRVSINPELPAVNTTSRYYEYDISIVPIDINYPDPEIRPLAMKPDPEAEHNHGYARLAGGTLQGIDGSVGYVYHHEDRYRIGTQLDFYNIADSSSRDEIKEQNINALLYGQYDWTDNYKVNAQLGGQLHKVELLGDGDNPRNITNIHLKTGLEKISEAYQEIAAKFDLEIGYTALDTPSLNELYIKTPLNVTKPFTDFSGLELNAITELNVASQDGLDSDFVYGGSLGYYNLIKGLSVRLGVNYLGHDSEQSIFPQVELSYPLSDNLITPFVRTNQDYSKNSLTNVLAYNPYFRGTMDSITTNVTQSISGGVKGLYSDELSYEVAVGYKLIKNQARYIGFTTYQLLQEDINAPFIEANISWELRDWVRLDLSGQKLFFEDRIFSTLLIPSLEAKIAAEISTDADKYYVKNEVIYRDGIRDLGFDDSRIVLDPIIKWDISAGYHINERFEIYAEGNNLLDRRNQRWSGYDGFGFQVLGGLKAVF